MDIQKILPKTGKYIKEIEESGSEKIRRHNCFVLERMIELATSFIAMSADEKSIFDEELLEKNKTNE